MREIGQEYGATTGRPRQIDWLNIEEVIVACQMNGVTKLIINKMDVLRQVNSAWNYYENNMLISCANEDTFISNILKEVNIYLPRTQVEFQGQLH